MDSRSALGRLFHTGRVDCFVAGVFVGLAQTVHLVTLDSRFLTAGLLAAFTAGTTLILRQPVACHIPHPRALTTRRLLLGAVAAAAGWLVAVQ